MLRKIKGHHAGGTTTENIVVLLKICLLTTIFHSLGLTYMMIIVPTAALIPPHPTRLFRPLCEDHVNRLAKELHIHPTEKPLILGHIPDISAAAIEKSSLQGGIYDIECIGGNHTREAIKGLRSDDPQNEYLKFWPVRLYAGLTDQQALAKGHLHNMRHKLARQTTFEELVTYFGTELSHVLKGAQLLNDDGAFLQQIPHKAILQWKRLLCTVIFQKPVSFSIL
jgi:hypothetical protein